MRLLISGCAPSRQMTDDDRNPWGESAGLVKPHATGWYSVLNDSRQLFASRYRLTLPSEEELQRELQREPALIEDQAR